jgi:hydroxymethylbilane synthase
MAIRIATRGSALALWQAEHVARLLERATELVVVQTSGDRDLSRPIWEMGGKGVFVKEVQSAVLDGRADLAVHSAKDLPSETPDGLVLGAVPERGDVRDALIGSTLDQLGPGARVATGSVRRRVQLAAHRPDLTFAGLRGNIATRLEKAGEFEAIVMASVALDRLGLADRITQRLEPAEMLPQVGQGALAIECRVGDGESVALLDEINHHSSRQAVDAERAYLSELGGDCDLPAGALGTIEPDGHVSLEVLLASLDGHRVLRERRSGHDPAELGRACARYLIDECGGQSLLDP